MQLQTQGAHQPSKTPAYMYGSVVSWLSHANTLYCEQSRYQMTGVCTILSWSLCDLQTLIAGQKQVRSSLRHHSDTEDSDSDDSGAD